MTRVRSATRSDPHSRTRRDGAGSGYFCGWSLARCRSRRGIPSSLLVFGALTLLAPDGVAGDGAYGRFDGDLELSLAAGVALTDRAPDLSARFAAHYVSMAGLYVGYADALGQSSARLDRSLALGVTIKPLFWGRFASDLETGSARLDLFIDSLVLELGPYWAAPRGLGLAAEPGMEFAVGLGFPILERATGPFLEVRGALRVRKGDMPERPDRDPVERGAMLTFAIAWHHIVPVHIVDAGDRVLR